MEGLKQQSVEDIIYQQTRIAEISFSSLPVVEMKNVTELFTRNNLSFLPFLLNKSPSVDISIFIFLKIFCILCFFGFFEEILLRLLRIAREAAAPFKNDLALTEGFALQ